MAEHEATLNDLLVAFGRLEAQLEAVNEKLDRLDNMTEKRLEAVEARLAELESDMSKTETRVTVLEVQRPRKVSAWVISSAVVSIVTIAIVVLDRFYVKQ